VITLPVTKIVLRDKLLLLGPPGIGKTEVIISKAKQEAEAKGKIFIDLKAATIEEIIQIFKNPNKYYVLYTLNSNSISKDEFGIPRVQNAYGYYFMRLIPPAVLAVLEIPDIEGVLFIDEITSLFDDNLFTMYYSIIQAKEASWFYRFSKKIKVVLAGNPPDSSSLSRVLPEALRNRLTIVYVTPPSIDEWHDYMMNKYGNNWGKFAFAYLKIYPNDFYKPPANDNENFPTPRSWDEVARMLVEIEDKEVLKAYIVGRLGVEVGSRFLSLLETRITEEDINNVIRFPPNFSQLDIDKRLLVVYSVASRINAHNYKQYFDFLKYLGKEREFLILILQLMEPNTRLALLNINELKNIIVPLLKLMIQYESGEYKTVTRFMKEIMQYVGVR